MKTITLAKDRDIMQTMLAGNNFGTIYRNENGAGDIWYTLRIKPSTSQYPCRKLYSTVIEYFTYDEAYSDLTSQKVKTA